MPLARSICCFLFLVLLLAGDALAQCRVEGVVRAADKTPLAGATVRIEVPEQRVPLSATAGADGSYAVENVKPGTWVRVVVLQSGRIVGQSFALVTQRVERIDVESRPLPSGEATVDDLDAAGGPSGSLGGVVRDADGTPVPSALVSVGDTVLSATTDSAGRYLLHGLRAGVGVELRASAAGFGVATAQVLVPDDTTLETNFTLQPAEQARSLGLSALHPAEDTGQVDVRPGEAGVPSPGRGDVFRTLQFLPGVPGTEEAPGDLYVRGGAPGETLVSLDGFTLYPAARLFTLFTPFNGDAIERADFSKSAVAASDGGRLSGVLRLSGASKAGGKPAGSLELSAFGPRAAFSVPLADRGSLLLAARRSFTGSLYADVLDAFAPGGGTSARDRAGRSSAGAFALSPRASFRDFNGKIDLRLTAKDRLTATVYDARENANNSRDLQLSRDTSIAVPPLVELPSDAVTQVGDVQEWKALGVSGAWTRRWSPSAGTTFSVGRSESSLGAERAWVLASPASGVDYSFIAGRGGSGGLVEANRVRDTTVRLDNSVALGLAHALSFGAEVTSLDVETTIRAEVLRVGAGGTANGSTLADLLRRDGSARLLTAFAQDAWRPIARLVVTPGFRVTRYDVSGETLAEPRLGLNYRAASLLHLKAAWGIDHQAISRITNEDRVHGDREFWALADGTSIPVARGQQVSAGWSVETPAFLLDMQGYYKRLEDLTLFAPRFFPGVAPAASNPLFHHGTGTSRGVEVALQREWSRNTVWTSYTLSRTEHEFPTLEAQVFPASQDRRHELKVADSFRIMARWLVTGAWVLSTGRPYTPAESAEPVWFASGLTLRQVTFGSKNSARLPAYHRLDLSTSREFRIGAFKSALGVTVFNVYNRRNVAFAQYEIAAGAGTLTTNDFTLMGRAVNAFVRVGF